MSDVGRVGALNLDGVRLPKVNKPMTVMVSNNSRWLVHVLAAHYGGVGHLYSPGRFVQPLPHLPYACDNGAWGAFKRGIEFDDDAYKRHVDRYAVASIRPLWVVAKDKVGDRSATLEMYDEWAEYLLPTGIPIAIAVQDGMTVEDVRKLSPAPTVIFIGGSTEWKWTTVSMWAENFPRVHLARCNMPSKLRELRGMGIESIDGTGWMRGNNENQTAGLCEFLALYNGMNYVPRDGQYRGKLIKAMRHSTKDQGHLCLEGEHE